MGQEPRNPGPAIRALTGAAVLVLLAAGATAAHAQFRLVSSARANGSAPAEPAYVDRVIEGLAPDEGKPVEEVVYNREGWPRFLRLETRLGTQPSGDRDRSVGFTAAGAIETPNHGVLSIDANLAVDEKRGVVTLRQQAAALVARILATDEESIQALADAELARRAAVASLEQGETTLAAYRRVLSPTLAQASLLDRRG